MGTIFVSIFRPPKNIKKRRGRSPLVKPLQVLITRDAPHAQAKPKLSGTEDIYPVSTEDATAAGLRPAAVPESSGCAWACGVFSGAPRRGLTRGEESEEGGERVHLREDTAPPWLHFSMFLGGLKIDAKMVPQK